MISESGHSFVDDPNSKYQFTFACLNSLSYILTHINYIIADGKIGLKFPIFNDLIFQLNHNPSLIKSKSCPQAYQ